LCPSPAEYLPEGIVWSRELGLLVPNDRPLSVGHRGEWIDGFAPRCDGHHGKAGRLEGGLELTKCFALAGSALLALTAAVGAAQVPPAPIPETGTAVVLPAEAPVTLFECVKYKDQRNIAPCAVPMIVSVPDPCASPCDCACGPRCVYVKICVPPCGCAEVKYKRHGEKLVYDFGKYEVEITSRKGVVVVDYDD